MKDIEHLESISPRVCFVVLKLNQKYIIKFIQAYVPTPTHTDEKVEAFYDDFAMALSKVPTDFSFMAGDFIVKVGKRQDESEFVIGTTWIQFLLEHLYAMNTFFIIIIIIIIIIYSLSNRKNPIIRQYRSSFTYVQIYRNNNTKQNI